jgi:hypothetical protein
MTTVVKIGVDGFPIDPANIYYEQHLAIDPIIEEALKVSVSWNIKIQKYTPTQLLMKQECKFQLQTIFAIFERLNWLDNVAFPQSQSEFGLLKIVTALSQLLDKIVAKELGYEEIDLESILRWCLVDYLQKTQYLINYGLNLPINKILSRIEKYSDSRPLSEEMKAFVSESRSFGGVAEKVERILINQSGTIDLSKLLDLRFEDRWANTIFEQIARLTGAEKEDWNKLLVHASTATAATPSAKWLVTARSLLEQVGTTNFKSYVSGWFELVDRSPLAPIAERNRLILTGLIWIYSLLSDEIELESIADLTIKCYHKIPNVGPVCLKAGNAGLWLLGEIGTFQAIDCMEKLRQKVKNQAIQKQIEKYLNLAAQKTGLSREDLEELSIPTYNLDRDGTFQQTLGTATATIKILGTQKVELS